MSWLTNQCPVRQRSMPPGSWGSRATGDVGQVMRRQGRTMRRQVEPRSTEHLRSWNEGPAKTAITSFVQSVTEAGESFVPPGQRIATFDNDGTLWCEKPMYPQADFLVRRWAEQVKAEPARATQQPWKAVAEGDRAWFAAARQTPTAARRSPTRWALSSVTTAVAASARSPTTRGSRCRARTRKTPPRAPTTIWR